jgi:hypothetical protein
MEVKSEEDFTALRQHIERYRKRFPMFVHDIVKIEHIVEEHIKQYSIAMVYYRQSHSKSYLEKAQKEIDSINQLLSTVGKIELMALLSQG